MEIKGIAEECFRCKYDCEMIIEESDKPQMNEYGELVKTKTTQRIIFRDELQKTFDFIVRRLDLHENSAERKSGNGTSYINLQFKIVNNGYCKHLTYEVILKRGMNVDKRITIISTQTAYKILARAFRETLGITVWQDKID